MDIEVRVCGIPGVARVTHYHKQKPLGPSADSDIDCYGYTDLEYEILDRRGRAAPWLNRKLDADPSARRAVEEKILVVLEGADDE